MCDDNAIRATGQKQRSAAAGIWWREEGDRRRGRKKTYRLCVVVVIVFILSQWGSSLLPKNRGRGLSRGMSKHRRGRGEQAGGGGWKWAGFFALTNGECAHSTAKKKSTLYVFSFCANRCDTRRRETQSTRVKPWITWVNTGSIYCGKTQISCFMSLIDRSRSPTAGTHPPTFDHGSLIYPNLSHRFNLRVTSLIWAINQNVWWLPLLSRYCVYPGRPLIPPTPSPAHTHIRQTHTHCLETAFKRLHTPTQTLKCLIYKVGGFLQTSVTLFALHISREAFIQSAGALCVFTLGEHCLSFNSQQCRAILSFFFFF